MAMAISFGICLYRHVIATDGPLVRSRIHCNAARTSRDGDPCKFLEIRHSGVTRITEQRHFIDFRAIQPFSCFSGTSPVYAAEALMCSS